MTTTAAPELLPDGTHWRQHANCRGADTNIFFPETGGSNKKALAYCNNCPVTTQCLEFAINATNPVIAWGIWAGHSEKAIRMMRTDRNHKPHRMKQQKQATVPAWHPKHQDPPKNTNNDTTSAYSVSPADNPATTH